MDIPDDLLARLRAGNGEAVAEYAQLKRPQLVVYINNQLGYLLRSKIEPDDLVQEMMLRAVQQAAFFAQNDRDPFGILCHFAQECIVDAHRRLVTAQKRSAKRETPLGHGGGGSNSSQDGASGGLINLLVASITSPSRALSRNDREFRMWEALANLPEEQREALRMRYYENMPSKDIAEKLGKSDGAIRVMLTRALDKLQKILATESQAESK
jgi:RNA polymerase sigma-70 factor, ECF subfamily